jgi:hypothetical protein
MRYYPDRVWSAFTNSGSNIPIWNTIKEINGLPLPEDDWQWADENEQYSGIFSIVNL